MYFPQGHRQFLEEEKRSLFRSELPWKKYSDLDHCVFGHVSCIKYNIGEPNYCSLTLDILERREMDNFHVNKTKNTRKVTVDYYDRDGVPNFIITYQLFKWGISRRFRIGEMVKIIFDESDAFDAKIMALQVSPSIISTKPWKCYLADW